MNVVFLKIKKGIWFILSIHTKVMFPKQLKSWKIFSKKYYSNITNTALVYDIIPWA